MSLTKDVIETRMRAIVDAWQDEEITAVDVATAYRRRYGDAPDLHDLADHTLRLMFDPGLLPMSDDPAECRALGEAMLRQAEACEREAAWLRSREKG